MEKPKKIFTLSTGWNSPSKHFYEWEEDKANHEFEFWKNYYNSNDKTVILYKNGKAIKKVTYKVEIIEEDL